MFLVISNVTFMASKSLIHSLRTFSNIFFVATFACKTVYAIVALAIKVSSDLQCDIFRASDSVGKGDPVA